MEQLLRQFYNDKHLNEAVKEFLIIQLREMAIEYVFEGKDTGGIKEARQVIDNSFAKLKEIYEPKEKTVIDSPR